MKPYIETQPFSQDVRLHFLARNLSGRSSVMTNATFTEIEDGQLLPPAPLSMSREEAQDLADQLYAANIRPSAAAGSTGQLEAIQYHLEDMRLLALKDILADEVFAAAIAARGATK